jgi:hypothetical protein
LQPCRGGAACVPQGLSPMMCQLIQV